MRLFRIGESSEFVEFNPQPFDLVHTERTMESWLEANPGAITDEGGLLLIGRQVTTNLGGFIDLLGVDRHGDVAVMELKRGRTPRETLAQALEYASFVHRLDYGHLNELYQTYTGDSGRTLADVHRDFFHLAADEGVSFNNGQHIVIVGSELSASVRQTCEYLNAIGLPVTCLEFGYYSSAENSRLMSIEAVVRGTGSASPSVTTGTSARTTQTTFLQACDDAGRELFRRILALADSYGLPIHWGSRGFSLNAATQLGHVNLCQGYPAPDRRGQAKQALIITMREIARKLQGADDLIAKHRALFESTTLFALSGSVGNLTYTVTALPTEAQIERIIALLVGLAGDVRQLSEQSDN